jgi:hypothetical protein
MIRIGNVFVRAGDIKEIDLHNRVARGYGGEAWPMAEGEGPRIVRDVEKAEREGCGSLAARIGAAEPEPEG